MALEDPIAGADQLEKMFHKTVHCRFFENVSKSSAEVECRYGLESADSVRKHVTNLPADVQNFLKTLPSVRACVYARMKTGMPENQVTAMAVAVHEGKCETILYKYKSFDSNNWTSFKTWLIRQNNNKRMRPTAHENEDDVDVLAGLTPNHGLLYNMDTVEGCVSALSAFNHGAVELNSFRDSPTIRMLEERLDWG